jgi:hypothetical protein
MLLFQARACRALYSSSESACSSAPEGSLIASFQSGQANAGRAKPMHSRLARNASIRNSRLMKCVLYSIDVL